MSIHRKKTQMRIPVTTSKSAQYPNFSDRFRKGVGSNPSFKEKGKFCILCPNNGKKRANK